jgi:hypothetical protein
VWLLFLLIDSPLSAEILALLTPWELRILVAEFEMQRRCGLGAETTLCSTTSASSRQLRACGSRSCQKRCTTNAYNDLLKCSSPSSKVSDTSEMEMKRSQGFVMIHLYHPPRRPVNYFTILTTASLNTGSDQSPHYGHAQTTVG